MKTCGYCNCNNEAVIEIQQTVGKCQLLYMCEKHMPKWAKENNPSRFYRIVWKKDDPKHTEINRVGPFWDAIQSILNNYHADNLNAMTKHHAIVLACAFKPYNADLLTAHEYFCFERACEIIKK